MKNEIYNLVGLYSVFQGVVFTAVAQENDRFTSRKSFTSQLYYRCSIVSSVSLVFRESIRRFSILRLNLRKIKARNRASRKSSSIEIREHRICGAAKGKKKGTA